MVRFHQALSDESVYSRYAGTLALSQRIAHDRLARRCSIDPAREVALVAEVAGEAGAREIGGVGRLTRSGDDADLGLLVLDRYQHEGVGTELLRRLVEAGRAAGLRRITADVLLSNGAMRHVCEKLGFVITDAGDVEGPMIRAVRVFDSA